MNKLKLIVKSALYPGLDLHTRCRYRFLSREIQEGPLRTLDAGFGNGAMSLKAYRKGNRVVGVTVSAREVAATRALFDHWGIPRDKVEFLELNLYDLRKLDQTFDQIVCSETLEHITRDAEVVRSFADVLRPGGRLILCCPNAKHPEHALGRTNEPENGQHVRDGYTLETYRALLEPAGFTIVRSIGYGSASLYHLDRVLRRLRNKVGEPLSIPLFLAMLPFSWMDRPDPPVPFSTAVVAVKNDASAA